MSPNADSKARKHFDLHSEESAGFLTLLCFKL